MADTPSTPDAPDTLSSYSDPLYDRLEGVVRSLGRKWWIILVLALASAAIAVVLQQRAQQVPEAASANAYLSALDEGEVEALAKVAADDAVLPEFRARAALEAADLALVDGDAQRAAELLKTAEKQAAATPLKDLQLTIQASQAAVLEEQGEFEQAAAVYTQVADKSATLPGLNLVATLGAARSTRAQAETTSDEALKLELLQIAHEQFSFAAERAVSGAETLNDYARLQRYDLERRYPQLIGGEALEAGETAAPAEETAEADAPAEETAGADEAPAEGESPAE